MAILTPAQRRDLEATVEVGRELAEAAAESVVGRLGVGARVAPPHLTADERMLRRGLRARASQLGDLLDEASTKVTSCRSLVAEVAYEQWHRLLFARFLEVNGLLRYSEFPDVSLSLSDCEELATDAGDRDGWSVATRLAAEILPGIFRPADPCVRVQLAREDLLALERVVTGIPVPVFTAEDSLGWVYQYWQSQAKKNVNESGRKIGAADLAPVTQLFTENYMVRFLLDNSLGAWWASRHPQSPLLAELRYLRKSDGGGPVVGPFQSWPAQVAQVTIMDPCCGSGHFLVAAFGMLWRMRAEEENLLPAEAQDAVLRENLFGLELDPRCTQIAMFALALEAWKHGGFRELPTPNVACSGVPAKAPLSDWRKLADGAPRLATALGRLHALFAEADTLGSLIDPVQAAQHAGLESVDWSEVSPLLEKALQAEATTSGDPAAEVFGDAAATIARAADLLSRRYTLVVTNVPYLGKSRQSTRLSQFCDHDYPASTGDLAAVMLERCIALTERSGTSATVTPQSWTSQSGFKKLRRILLRDNSWHIIARLGSGAFAAISGEVVQPVLAISSRIRSSSTLTLIDAATAKGTGEKSSVLAQGPLLRSDLKTIRESEDYRIRFAATTKVDPLHLSAKAGVGIQTGDNERFTRFFWEFSIIDDRWIRYLRSPATTGPSQGRSRLLLWEDGKGELIEYIKTRLGTASIAAWIRGRQFWGQRGIAISRMAELPATLYLGEAFADNLIVVVPVKADSLPSLWAFAVSKDFNKLVRETDRGLNVTPGTVTSIPYDAEHWDHVAREAGSGAQPSTTSADPVQWTFSGQPQESEESLQVAVARLLDFSWPDQPSDVLDEFADKDGIVAIPSVAGERAAADRLWDLLARAYGDGWSQSKLDNLLIDADGKPGDVDDWLRDAFFKNHCKVFANRPFIWHIWDGHRKGFAALVNYHKLNYETLQRLTYTTLGWWIDRQRADAEDGVTGGEERLSAAQQLQRQLQLILEGEPPYDLYIRWKPLAEQPLGWNPSLDDGVRYNIRPFVKAGVLRHRFNISWKKDRGTNPDGSQRENDLHYTLAERRKAQRLGD